MEQISFTSRTEESSASTLQAEWLDSQISQKPAAGKSEGRIYAFAQVSDKQEADKETVSDADRQRAATLDRELREFSSAKVENPSHNMENFQKAIGKFCDAQDKDTALDQLGDTWSRISNLMNIGVEAIYNELKLEVARQPGRKELEADYKRKQREFSDKTIDLPFDEYMRIQKLMEHQSGETEADYRQRVRAGLAGNKKVLDAFNSKEAAKDAIETSKSPREKELESLSKQIYSDAKIMKQQLEKAYIRSTLKH